MNFFLNIFLTYFYFGIILSAPLLPSLQKDVEKMLVDVSPSKNFRKLIVRFSSLRNEYLLSNR